MLSLAKLYAGQQQYYEDSVARGLDEYYAGVGERPGQWIGRGAELLGVSGELGGDELNAILDGRTPTTGARLTDRTPKVSATTPPLADVRPRANEAMLLAMAEADLRGVLPRVNVPTLLLYGERDLRSPVDVGRALHKAIPGSSLVVLPGVGHLSNVEAADHFNREVRSFLEQIRD